MTIVSPEGNSSLRCHWLVETAFLYSAWSNNTQSKVIYTKWPKLEEDQFFWNPFKSNCDKPPACRWILQNKEQTDCPNLLCRTKSSAWPLQALPPSRRHCVSGRRAARHSGRHPYVWSHFQGLAELEEENNKNVTTGWRDTHKNASRAEIYLNYRSPQAGGSQWYWKEATHSWIPLVCRRTSEGEQARRHGKRRPSWDQQELLQHQCWLEGEPLEPVWEEAGHTNKTLRLFAFMTLVIQARLNDVNVGGKTNTERYLCEGGSWRLEGLCWGAERVRVLLGCVCGW